MGWRRPIIGAVFCIILAGCSQKKTDVSPPIDRLQWNLNTTVGIYRNSDATGGAWDQYATNALIEFAKARANAVSKGELFSKIIETNAVAAKNAGCNDPLVNYLYVKYHLVSIADKDTLTAALVTAATEINKSAYPPLRKFYASFWAMNQYQWANNYPTNHPASVAEINRQMIGNYQTLLDDKNIPVGEIFDATHEFLGIWEGNAQLYQTYYGRIEPTLFKNWPESSESWLIKAEAYCQLAWQDRGGGYANAVPQEQWKKFFDKLTIAETAADKAWTLNSSNSQIATLMIKIDEGLQKKRPDMEMWFARAMDLAPNNYDACRCKLHYLYPQWYGSRDDMLAFGRECVANTNWGGYVPITLVDAHTEFNQFSTTNEETRLAYWKQPDVWPDIKAAYDRFFQLNPEETGIYKNYASYAYHADQWTDFLKIAEKVRPEDYSFFGDKGEFSKMITHAKESLAGNSPEKK